MSRSQPLVRLLASQSAKPAVQAPAQLPLEQSGATLVAEHGASQDPQCAVLVERFSSQPLAGLPSQLARPDKHVQAPETHCVPASVAQSVPPVSQPEPMALQTAARVPSHPG